MISGLKKNKGIWITLLSFVLAVVLFFVILGTFREKITDEQAEQLRNSIVNAAVNAYSVTGRYPTLEEICEEYGTVIDREHFHVYYDLSLGTNNMPDVRVSVKEEFR